MGQPAQISTGLKIGQDATLNTGRKFFIYLKDLTFSFCQTCDIAPKLDRDKSHSSTGRWHTRNRGSGLKSS